MPTHVTEALRTNMSGGKTVAQLLAEAAATVPFMSLAELKARVEAGEDDLIVLDVREREAYEAGHIPGARLLPRGQLELRVNQDLPDPTRRILTCCEFGLHLDAGGGDPARHGLPARGRARRRHEGLARGRLSAARPGASPEQTWPVCPPTRSRTTRPKAG